MEVRRRTTLSDQMAISNSSNLGDLLKVKEENERRETVTLGSILGCSNNNNEKQEIADAAEAARRTLFDIIRDEEGGTDAYRGFVCTSSGAGAGDGGSSRNKISWKFFKDRLPLRRSAAAWISSPHSISISTDFIEPVPAGSTAEISSSDDHDSVRITSQSPARNSVRTDLASALAAERQQREEEERAERQQREEEEREVVASPARVSLMALMEQTDVCTVAMEGEGQGEEVIEEKEEKGRGVGSVCCVCMVRKKGAAFIPCGHTFCRVCSRELWISRGSCPLCNTCIQEVLDIF
eukprot:TRINITY_DN12016_c0_g1_i1.p1 TRINITY_DN12016_c0_g1~~TRINITY_DN12016_c0_g1_i1.p1  ORF type:complete len:295 (+),score=42.25 TRINITY_DN12016_c0_g1_i1:951-1835(+)